MKNKLRNIISYIFIFVIIFSFISLIILLISSFSELNSPIEYKSAIQKANNLLDKCVKEEGVKDFFTVEEFENVFTKRLPIHEYLSFDINDVKKYNLARYYNKPTFQTTDGIIYSIVKFKPGCNFASNGVDYAKSDCVIEVDVNGLKKPNKRNRNYNSDRYMFIYFKEGNFFSPVDPYVDTAFLGEKI